MSDQYERSLPPARHAQAPPPQQPPARQDYRPAYREQPRGRLYTMTAAATFWYIVGNIAFGATYFAKVPAKKAMAEAGLCDLTSAEAFWYVLQCIAFGAGYFAKVPIAKALSELDR
jgi:hypothetical protein